MAKFYTVPTAVGEAKIANAIALGRTLTIAELAIGDGNGSLPNPDSDRTSLVNQVRRAPINTSVVDDDNPNWIVVEQVIPPDEGGWTIREIGLFDSDGDMIAYGNYPETYKPVLSEGSGRTQTIRFVMQVSDTAAVTLKVDPSIVLATRKLVDDKIDEHAQSRDHPDATTTQRGFVKKATRDATRQRSSTASVVTPGGLDGAMADHENASMAHRASQIALDKALDVFGDADTVQAVLALLGAAAKAANHNDIDGRDSSDAHPMSSISGLDDAIASINSVLNGLGAAAQAENHNGLAGRDSSDAHPMSAITGLSAAISAINQTLNGLGGAATRNVGTGAGELVESRTAARFLSGTGVLQESGGTAFLQFLTQSGDRLGYVGDPSSSNDQFTIRSDSGQLKASDERGDGFIWHDGGLTRSLAPTGWRETPDGLIEQWGPITASYQSVTFPVGFNRLFGVSVQSNRPSSNPSSADINNPSVNGFEAYTDITGGDGYWRAIGD